MQIQIVQVESHVRKLIHIVYSASKESYSQVHLYMMRLIILLQDAQIREETSAFDTAECTEILQPEPPFEVQDKNKVLSATCVAVFKICTDFVVLLCSTKHLHLLTEGYAQAALTVPHPTSASCQRGFL